MKSEITIHYNTNNPKIGGGGLLDEDLTIQIIKLADIRKKHPCLLINDILTEYMESYFENK